MYFHKKKKVGGFRGSLFEKLVVIRLHSVQWCSFCSAGAWIISQDAQKWMQQLTPGGRVPCVLSTLRGGWHEAGLGHNRWKQRSGGQASRSLAVATIEMAPSGRGNWISAQATVAAVRGYLHSSPTRLTLHSGPEKSADETVARYLLFSSPLIKPAKVPQTVLQFALPPLALYL